MKRFIRYEDSDGEKEPEGLRKVEISSGGKITMLEVVATAKFLGDLIDSFLDADELALIKEIRLRVFSVEGFWEVYECETKIEILRTLGDVFISLD